MRARLTICATATSTAVLDLEEAIRFTLASLTAAQAPFLLSAGQNARTRKKCSAFLRISCEINWVGGVVG
jgi:hypothetical protein